MVVLDKVERKMTQTHKIDCPKWRHVFERDDMIKRLVREATRLTNKSRDSFSTPEDLDRLDRATAAATKLIGA